MQVWAVACRRHSARAVSLFVRSQVHFLISRPSRPRWAPFPPQPIRLRPPHRRQQQCLTSVSRTMAAQQSKQPPFHSKRQRRRVLAQQRVVVLAIFHTLRKHPPEPRHGDLLSHHLPVSQCQPLSFRTASAVGRKKSFATLLWARSRRPFRAVFPAGPSTPMMTRAWLTMSGPGRQMWSSEGGAG